jgi:hypothetical protein
VQFNSHRADETAIKRITVKRMADELFNIIFVPYLFRSELDLNVKTITSQMIPYGL